MMRRTGSFAARDRRGHKYTLEIYTDFFLPRPSGGPAQAATVPAAEVRGRSEIRMPGGGTVTLIAKGEYRIDATGVYLHSADTAAP